MSLSPSALFRRVAAVSLVLAAAVPVSVAHAAGVDGHLAGRVIDTTGAALSGAKVTVTDPLSGVTGQTATDRNGRYGLDVAGGRYDLEVSGQVAGRPVTARVNGVTVGADTERDVVVIPHGVDFEGTVRDDAGAPIPNAWVRLGDPGERTDSEGRFHLRRTPGTYRLAVGGHQFDVSVERFTLSGDTHRELVVPRIPVQVNVVDGNGHTVDDAWVELNSREEDAPFELLPGKKTAAHNWVAGKADGAGHVEFDAMPTAAPFQIRVTPPRGSPLGSAELMFDPLRAPRRIDVVLPWLPRPDDQSGSVVSLSGTVRNLDGSIPSGDAGVYLYSSDDQEAWYAEVLGGGFSLTAPPGTYRLNVYGSDYAWEDEEDGSQHDGFNFSANVDEFHLSGNRTVELRLPFAPAEVTVLDHTGQPAAAEVITYTQKAGVELLPGATGTARIDNAERAGPDGRAAIMTLPGRASDVSVAPDAQQLSPYSGTVTPNGDRLTVTLPTPIPVRFTDTARGPSACPYFEVTGEEGTRWPSEPTCTVGLQAGQHHLANYSDSWGDSGDVEFEWHWIDADFTVSGPATLDLHLPESNRAQIDFVGAGGDPVGGALIMDSATERIDLGSGVEATVVVSNRYLDEGDTNSSFNAHLFGPTTFSGTFRSEDAPYMVTFAGLPLAAGSHVTIAYPLGEHGAQDPPTPPDSTPPPGGESDVGQTDPPAGTATNPSQASPSGYWALSSDGHVYNFGAAAPHGNGTTGAVDIEPSPTGKGYWTLNEDGQIQAFGDAVKLGDVDMTKLAKDETPASLSATPSGKGYWVFTNRGRAITFGDAPFLGDMSHVKLNGPVLGSVPTPSGQGYYMVASDGGIFAFGDATFAGSMGGKKLNAPVQSLVPDADGNGYWLVASDGGIFAFEAPFRGSMGSTKLNKPVVGMVRYGDGYLMVGADGGIFNFSSLPFSGSLGDKPPASPVVAVAALPAA